MQTLVSTIGGVPGTGAIVAVTAGTTTVQNATTMVVVGASVAASGASTVVVTVGSAAATLPGGTAGQIQFNSGGTAFGGFNPSITPQGRMTLTSGSPVMSADVTGTANIYYCTYAGNLIPVGGQLYTIPSDQIQLTLDTTNHANAKLYDCFCMISSGAVTMVTGPAWTNTTTRATAISLYSGVWTNGATITSAFNAGLAHTLVTNAGTYVGTLYTTASGQTGMSFNPGAASGGTNNFLGLYNAYNRVRYVALCLDSHSSWTNTSSTWVPMDAGATGSGLNNRISFVDGLAQSPIIATIMTASANSGGAQARNGVSLDSSSAAPGNILGNAGTNVGSLTVRQNFVPQLGFHFAQAMEQNIANAGTATFFNNAHLMLEIYM